MDGWEGERINMVENAYFRWPSKGQIMEITCPSFLLGMQSLHNKTLSHTPLVPLSFCKNSIVFILRWLPMYVSCEILVMRKKSAIWCKYVMKLALTIMMAFQKNKIRGIQVMRK
jgi:hypothetical protein